MVQFENGSEHLDQPGRSLRKLPLPAGRVGALPLLSEVVRAGLRLLEDHETQLAGLRAALVAGEDSGTPEPFDFDSFVASKKQ